jgi:nitronate monooxygenase
MTRQLGIELPIICGAMYPCSNPELVAAVSEAGGIGVIQPLSLVFVFKYDFREGLRYIKALTKKPIGLNVIVEKSSKTYEKRIECGHEAAKRNFKLWMAGVGRHQLDHFRPRERA